MSKRMIIAALGGISVIALSCALQDAAYAADEDIQEIVVTANKRAQPIDQVPIAISVVTADQMAALGITDIANISNVIPSLNVSNVNGYFSPYLRGVGSQGNGPGFENPVALYVDGVYYANQSVGLFGFNNIQQIEVDKGPQGTLFGRNATGGLVQVTTQDPTQTFSLRSSVAVGNYGTTNDSTYISRGLAEDLVADFALRGGRHDGYGTNEFNGQSVYDQPYDVAARSKWIYTPGDWKFVLIADYAVSRSSDNALTLVPGSKSLYTTGPASYSDQWNVRTNTQPTLFTNDGGVSIKAEDDLGWARISDVAAYRHAIFKNLFDYDGLPVPVTEIRIDQTDWQISNELNLSHTDGPLTWTTGLYYFGARAGMAPLSVIFPDEPAVSPGYPLGTISALGTQNTEALAGYGQATYAVTDAVNLTGGVRYSYERRSLDGAETASLYLPGSPQATLIPQTHQSASVRDPTYRAQIDYRPIPNMMVYATYNTGFKSGGYNVTTPNAPYYKPEKITAFEAGEKGKFLNGKLSADISAFYYRYNDIQLQVAEEAGTGFTNGGNARIYGLDSDFSTKPLGDLKLDLNLSLLHARYSRYEDGLTGALGGGVPVATANLTGNHVPHAPGAAFTLSAVYPVRFGDQEIVLTGNFYHNSGYVLESDNVVTQSAYSEFGASAQWQSADGHYSVILHGENLNDAVVKTVALTIPEGDQIQLIAPPRTFGITVDYAF